MPPRYVRLAQMTTGIRIAFVVCLTAACAAAEVADNFYSAIRNGDVASVKALAAASGVNGKDKHGTTPLMYAAAFGNVPTMKALLDAGADPNATSDSGATALMWAVNDIEKVRLLLAKGANVNAASKMGR